MQDKIKPYKKAMGQDKRRYKRFKVDVMEINGKMMVAKEVVVINISIGGILLKLDRKQKIGTEYALKIMGKDRAMSIKGTVIWAVIGGTRKDHCGSVLPVYTVGMKFRNLSNEKIIELKKFIENIKQEDQTQHEMHNLSGLRLNIRFHIDTQGKAILNFPESYKVKKLSLGGMLIESRHALKVENRLPMEIFPPEVDPISFLGRVVSCLLINNKGQEQYDIGIEFIDMSGKGRERLKEFIRLLHKMERNSSSL